MSLAEERGFSLIELLVVIAIIAIMSVIAIMSFSKGKELYKTDDQSLKLVDMLQEARFRALSQREVMRVEINMTINQVRIIDENEPDTEEDDAVIRTMYLLPQTDVKLNAPPVGFSATPPTPITCSNIQFASSNHRLSSGNNVAVFRFNMLGQVLNAGDSPTGDNAAVASSIITLWPPKKNDPTKAEANSLIRAITVLGNAGAIQYWKYNGTEYVVN